VLIRSFEGARCSIILAVPPTGGMSLTFTGKKTALLERSRDTLMRLVHVVFIFALIFPACAPTKLPLEPGREMPADSTFFKFLTLAKTGDEKAQHLIGFMLYFGEGVRMDRAAAHYWFHLSADQGNASAQLSLAVMHYLGQGVGKDIEEAERYFRLAKDNTSPSVNLSASAEVPRTLAELAERAVMRPGNFDIQGESTFATFCAGCHGLNGIAAYERAPSFALGERLDKNDEDLFFTITHGHGTMPAWRDKLSDAALVEALRFVRTLPQQYQNGIAQVLRTPPSLYFLFGPMSTDPMGIYQAYTH
jgi:TPR repeat protein